MQPVKQMKESLFAELLAEYMDIIGITDSEVAEQLRINKTIIFRWRTGEIKRPNNCEKFSDCVEFLQKTAQNLCNDARNLAKKHHLKKEGISLVPATVLPLKSELQRLLQVKRFSGKRKRVEIEELGIKAETLEKSLCLTPNNPDLKLAVLLLKAKILQLQAEELRSKPEIYHVKKAQALCLRAEILQFKPIEPNKLLSLAGCPYKIPDFRDKQGIILSEYERLVPFTTRPIIHPAQFFGRYEVLKKIFAHWNHIPLQHVAVIGPKQSGKTSLLNYIQFIHEYDEKLLRNGQQKNWLKQSCDWVLVDFENPQIQNPTDLLRAILEKLNLPIPEPQKFGDFIKIFEDNIHHPTVIMMDNIEEGIQSPHFDQTFWRNTMRYLGSNCNYLGFCITSRQPIEKLVELAKNVDKSSPFFNIFKAIKLGPFTEEEARELLSYYTLSLSTQHEASQLNNTLSPLSQDEITWILEQSQYWPALLQTLCETRYDAEEGEDWK